MAVSSWFKSEYLAWVSIAFPYLSDDQKNSFKLQARRILHILQTTKDPHGRQNHGHIFQGTGILDRLNLEEAHILFLANIGQDMSFMHIDFTPSNCIVNDDKIVLLIDWEMAGYISRKAAAEIHRQSRSIQRKHFTNTSLSEEKLQSIMWRNDLYDDHSML